MIDWFLCWATGHDWTCDAEQGVPPPDLDQMNVQREFNRYARPWCSRCRRYMKPRELLIGSSNWDANLKYRP